MSTATLRRRSSIGNYPRRDPVVEAAKRLRLGSETVHQLIYGPANVFHRAAVVVEELRKAGEGLRAEKLCIVIDVARASGPDVGLSAALKDRNKEIEQAEDRAEVRYERDPSDENARAWYDQLRLKIACNLQVMRALKVEHAL